MSENGGGSTATDLIAAASQVLGEGGYRVVAERFPAWSTPSTRLFEDQYGIVGIAVFETCEELLQSWPDVQAGLVNVISQHVGTQESKSWDGYLVLLTPGVAPSELEALDAVRQDTARLRKLVATGEDLKLATDVEQVLRPLLPLRAETLGVGHGSALDLLPRLLAARDIPEEITRLLVNAFQQQIPPLEQLHKYRGRV